MQKTRSSTVTGIRFPRTRINGQSFSVISTPEENPQSEIMTATRSAVTNATGEYVDTTDVSSQALNLLSIMGCTVISKKVMDKDYTLLDTQTDSTKLENPNILDSSDYSSALTRNISMDASFPDVNDPIYAGDPNPVAEEAVIENIIVEHATMGADSVGLAADLAVVNMDEAFESELKVFTNSFSI
tara:strand:+ start:242 stop:799 length:558 start_codon:yes stop_codon:yes gene_type:complete